METFTDFQSRVKTILEADPPKLKHITRDKTALEHHVKIGRAAYMDEFDVSSERAYKERCIKQKQISFHAHIGLNSWPATDSALKRLYAAGKTDGFNVDRVGICLDRRMSLPEHLRNSAISETGPMLASSADWMSIGSGVPIIPHMGDFMIGFPASYENTIHALEAGVTTIGNLSQYFSQEAPGWNDCEYTTLQTVKAIALMGRLRDKGTLVHSYLEDGFGALFRDCATIAGWAYLEKYIVETLLGAKLSHCIGGLTSDPVKRAGWVFALDEIHDQECIGSMFYGDTISFTGNLSTNSGLVSEYLLWDILAQIKCPTGHAVLPLPLTEGLRIPSVEEIIEAQTLGRRIEQTAHRLYPYVDFSEAESFARRVVEGGKKVFTNALDGLSQAGVDIRDPVLLLLTLKKLGPSLFEDMFGAGDVEDNGINKRRPLVKTDIFKLTEKSLDQHAPLFRTKKIKALLNGRHLLIASTDVHEHAIMVLAQLCGEAGAEILYLGAEKNPQDIAESAQKTRVDGILLSTHNGMALEYAKGLRAELDKRACGIPVMMGGVLNQKMENCELPVEVSSSLRELGFIPYQKLSTDLTHKLTELLDKPCQSGKNSITNVKE